jgi:hypothetical protein
VPSTPSAAATAAPTSVRRKLAFVIFQLSRMSIENAHATKKFAFRLWSTNLCKKRTMPLSLFVKIMI